MQKYDNVTKKVFSFPDDNRAIFDKIEIDDQVIIIVKNKEGKISIPFRVTRNAYLGAEIHWIYGEILNSPQGEYHQIEIKIHIGKPEKDTIEVFPQAPHRI